MASAIQTGEYLLHVTGHGQRWDTLANLYYADANAIGPIVEANRGLFGDLPELPAVLPVGLELKIPVIEMPAIDDRLLPPWKRGK